MNKVNYFALRNSIQETQDNKFLKEGDEVSDVILTILLKNKIEKNKSSNGDVDVYAASTDLGYFINQLQKAKNALDEFIGA